MTYESFAYMYDELMKDVPYEQWIYFINQQYKKYGLSGKEFLDLACGTGELSIRLMEEGYSVTGVDISADMLAVAREKADRKKLPLFLLEQDMSDLEEIGEFDLIGVFCDSLNYLQKEQDIIKTFEKVYQHLKPGGLFLFDVHSLYKMNHLFINQTYAYNGEEISYIWQCFQGGTPNSVEHELTFFYLDESTNQYSRYDELHIQSTYPIPQYRKWLEAHGFEVLSITADFQDKEPDDKSERIFFTTTKK